MLKNYNGEKNIMNKCHFCPNLVNKKQFNQYGYVICTDCKEKRRKEYANSPMSNRKKRTIEPKKEIPFIHFEGKKYYISGSVKTGALFQTPDFSTLDTFWGVIDEGIIYKDGEEIGSTYVTKKKPISDKEDKEFYNKYGIHPTNKMLRDYKLDKLAKRFFLKKKE